jgi:hypothetical protein
LLTVEQAPYQSLVRSFFLCDYNGLADERGHPAGAAGRPKYIFSMHLPPRCEEKVWFFKLMRYLGPA